MFAPLTVEPLAAMLLWCNMTHRWQRNNVQEKLPEQNNDVSPIQNNKQI